MPRENWDTIPLRYVSRLNPSISFDGLGDEDELTFLPMDRIKSGYYIQNLASLSKCSPSYTTFEEGDILLAKVTPCFENGNIAIASGLPRGKGFGTSEIFVLRPQGIERRFLFYFLQSSHFKQEGEASMTGAGGLKRVSPELLRKHHVPLPDRPIQLAVANYLDRETAEIDTLIAEKERMLALLEEKRAALISQAVTRGLDRKAPLKLSGLDWLGDIPARWQLRRCGTLFREIDMRGEPDLPLLNVSLNTGVTLRVFSEARIESVASDFNTYKVARKGQLVFNKMRFWQGAAGIAPEDGLTSPDYTVASLSPELEPAYVESLVRLPMFSSEVRRYSYGMVDDRLRLYWDGFRDIWIPLPPREEQKSIAIHITAETTRITEIATVLQQSISLLKERRAALITAAVTGQMPIEAMQP